MSAAWQPAAPAAALVTEDRGDSSLLLADFAVLGHDPTPAKNLASHRFLSFLILRTNHALLKDVQVSVHEYWRTDNVYQEPMVVFTGQAGGHFYNMGLDNEHKHGAGAMAASYRTLLIRGTANPIELYEPDTENADAGPQMEIASSKNVFLYAYKYEHEHPLLLVRDSSNVAVIGGSGNYSLYEAGESSVVTVSRSTNYVFANLARRPDRANPRDAAGGVQFAIIADDVARVAADRNNLALFKAGEVALPGAAGAP
jgi:hypothetical protein